MNAKQIVLACRPTGLPTKENFRTETIALPALQDDEVLVKGLFYSVDPSMRGRMNDVKSYTPPFAVNEPLKGWVIGEIEESQSDYFKNGDIVRGNLPWATEAVISSEAIEKIDTTIAPPGYFLGIHINRNTTVKEITI